MSEPIVGTATVIDPETAELNPEDGLYYCKMCHTPRQRRLDLSFIGRGITVVNFMCKCQREADEKEKWAEQLAIRHRKNDLINNKGNSNESIRKILEECNFSVADRDSENLDKAMLYVERFDQFKEDAIGLMLYGDVGNGKTFMAACIANALMERHRTVLMITPDIYMAMSFEDRHRLVHDLYKYELLIIDDFGVQRDSGFANEQMFSLIDGRCKLKLPLLITTNLAPSDFQNPQTRDAKRLYDRINEMCMPMQFKRPSRREMIRKAKMEAARKIFQ